MCSYANILNTRTRENFVALAFPACFRILHNMSAECENTVSLCDQDTAPISVVYVDDDPMAGRLISRYLRDIGCRFRDFTDPALCLSELRTSPADILITDLRMPVMDGLAVLKTVKDICPSTEVIIVTGDADKNAAIQALKLGAFDFLEKPVKKGEIVETIKRTIRYRTVVQERDRFAEQLSFIARQESTRWGIGRFVGKSKAMASLLADIRLLQATDKTTVLITGESGVGKELVARAIHSGSERSSRPFVAVNCSSIPDSLAESILFGHVRGAFTGATKDKKGSFELAHGGALFLDEIGDMLPGIQAKLLRVLEDGTVDPVGSTASRRVDARIIAATNADLEQKVAAGTFRTDLYHRLSAFRISMPALRDRKDDIPLLAEHFASILSGEMGRAKPDISAEALEVLQTHSYPGNVRELKNIIEQALIRSAGGRILPSHIRYARAPTHVKNAPSRASESTDAAAASRWGAADLPLNLSEIEGIAIRHAMAISDGNTAAAARLLGINRTKLYRKLAMFGREAAGSAPETR